MADRGGLDLLSVVWRMTLCCRRHMELTQADASRHLFGMFWDCRRCLGTLADLPTSLSGLHSADQWRWIPFFAGMDAISSWAHDARYS